MSGREKTCMKKGGLCRLCAHPRMSPAFAGGGRKALFSLAALLLLLAVSTPALAVGTAAGTQITNQAEVTFVSDGTTLTRKSNETRLRVDEVLNVTLQSQDAGNIQTKAGDTDRVETFRLTNTGNAGEAFSLTADNHVSGNQFNPPLVGVYLDANGNGKYDAGTDPLYKPGANDPKLAADASVDLFVVENVPAGTQDGALGKTRLSAAAKTGTGAPGKAFPGVGVDGVTAVVGPTGGAASAEGTLQVAAVKVSVVKSAVVADPLGGTQPMSTATITYSIVVTVSGSGTAPNVIVTDPIPADTSYVAGSLKLDGTGLTDAADGDAGEVAGGKVTVRLGDLESTVKTVTFQVVID